MNWFTIEKLNNNTYAISEYNHWEEVHSYLLLGEKSALLIDTGLGIGNIKKEVEKLTDMHIKVISTHIHWDHIGGHKEFKYIYAHEDEVSWLKEGIPIPLEVVKKNVVKDVKEFPKGFDIDKYSIYTGDPFKIVKDGDIIDIGNRKIEIIHTPGHSPGHICLYDRKYDYLFTGDLIYSGTLYAFYPSTDPLEFKNSVGKLLKYKNIKKCLPSHHDLDIPVKMIRKVYNGFLEIEDICGLKQGAGVFDFDGFSIYI